VSTDGAEVRLAALVLAAAALVLAAPVVGRAGHPVLADVVMALAAACAFTSFGVAAFHTVRAARRAPRPGSEEDPK
jgi:hypothetical protein